MQKPISPQPEQLSSPAGQAKPTIEQHIASIRERYARWYPRWWIIAALLCTLTVALSTGLWNTVLCPATAFTSDNALVCQLGQASYLVQVLLIWALFLCFWLLAFVLGLRPIESPAPRQRYISEALQVLTTFRPLHVLLLTQGLIACLLINSMWWLNHTPPIPFALLTIAAFVAHCSLFYRSSAEKQRFYLILYGFVALLLLIIEGLFKSNLQEHWSDEWLLLILQGLLVLTGLITIFWRTASTISPRSSPPPTLTPYSALGSIWPFNRILPAHLIVAANETQPTEEPIRPTAKEQ